MEVVGTSPKVLGRYLGRNQKTAEGVQMQLVTRNSGRATRRTLRLTAFI